MSGIITASDLYDAREDMEIKELAAECNRLRVVIVYQITCDRAYAMYEQGTGYSLAPWGENTEYYEGDDDGGTVYILPDGYQVGTTSGGYELVVWDDKGSGCTITGSKSPHLQSSNRSVKLTAV